MSDTILFTWGAATGGAATALAPTTTWLSSAKRESPAVASTVVMLEPVGVLAEVENQKKQTLNPLSISLNPLQDDPKKTQNPAIKGSSEAFDGYLAGGQGSDEAKQYDACELLRLGKKKNPKPPINFR